jgi:hypothetical protein
MLPRLSADEAEESDYMDPFSTVTFDIMAKTSSITATTKTISNISSPTAFGQSSSRSNGRGADQIALDLYRGRDGRWSPDPIQSYYSPIPGKIYRDFDDDVQDLQVGGERRLFVVNASPDDSDDE